MTTEQIPIGRRVALVRAAIERIEQAEGQTSRYHTGGDEFAAAAVELGRARLAFVDQWQNVKAILEAYYA